MHIRGTYFFSPLTYDGEVTKLTLPKVIDVGRVDALRRRPPSAPYSFVYICGKKSVCASET